jgi:hypothetical protein
MIRLTYPPLFWTLALAAPLCGCASFEHDYRVLQCKVENLYCDSPDVQTVLAYQKARLEAQEAAVLEQDRQWRERNPWWTGWGL